MEPHADRSETSSSSRPRAQEPWPPTWYPWVLTFLMGLGVDQLPQSVQKASYGGVVVAGVLALLLSAAVLCVMVVLRRGSRGPRGLAGHLASALVLLLVMLLSRFLHRQPLSPVLSVVPALWILGTAWVAYRDSARSRPGR